MNEKDDEVDWQVQKKLNRWDEKRRAKAAVEELMEGKVRYLKFIKNQLGPDAIEKVLERFVIDTFDKNMGGLTKLGAGFLKKISKNALLKKIISSFYINMQHLVDLDCLKKLEFYPNQIEIVIKKCTAKRAWKLGLKNNKAKDLFSEDDYCQKVCIPTFNKFLQVANAQSNYRILKRGCEQVISFVDE
ncbi:MAG: hypothetical protein ACTSYB_18685 [Candidatus Helarchaeota archaeon]